MNPAVKVVLAAVVLAAVALAGSFAAGRFLFPAAPEPVSELVTEDQIYRSLFDVKEGSS